MDTAKFLWILAMLGAVALIDGKAALRRKPKIYNALITTDENLVQSRAYPVIQPTIHETGIAHYSVDPYSPYGFYNPHLVRFAQPIAPSLPPKDQMPQALVPTPFPPQLMARPQVPYWYPGYPPPMTPSVRPADEQPPTAPASEQPSPTRQPPTMLMDSPPVPVNSKDPNQVEKISSEPLPIPLNQHGLPPSLIPIRPQYPQPPTRVGPYGQPLFLPPYGFQQYPPMFQRGVPVLRQPYLPHYGYYPTGPQFPLSNAIPTDKTYPTAAPALNNPFLPQVTQLPPPEETPATQEETQATPAIPNSTVEPEPPFESIKNGSKSEDTNVPDVPPPPIPSGAKSKES